MVRRNQVIYSKKIVMMAIHEESSKFGMVKQMGGCAQEVSAFQRQETEISSKNI